LLADSGIAIKTIDRRHAAAMAFQVLSYYRASIARAKQDLNREGEKETKRGTRSVACRAGTRVVTIAVAAVQVHSIYIGRLSKDRHFRAARFRASAPRAARATSSRNSIRLNE